MRRALSLLLAGAAACAALAACIPDVVPTDTSTATGSGGASGVTTTTTGSGGASSVTTTTGSGGASSVTTTTGSGGASSVTTTTTGSGGAGGGASCGDRTWAHWKPGPQSYTTTVETVTDATTGLTWERHPNAFSADWAGSKAHCDALSLGQSTDWRLPTRIELLSLVDPSQSPVQIDTVAFPDVVSGHYWTASAYVKDATRAWTVQFGGGLSAADLQTDVRRVVCVR